MDMKGSRTEDVLEKAFDAEVRTLASYRYFAGIARQVEQQQIADVFEAIAANEAEHARHEFTFLGWGGDVIANLQNVIEREHHEATRLYPQAAEVAASEGFTEIAAFFKRMSEVEARHEKLFRDLLEALTRGAQSNKETVGHSEVTMAQVMLPEQANPAGFVHGGELMKLMDNAAGVAAVRHCHGNVVTARVEEMEFNEPVRIGSLVIVHARLFFVSRSSMWVRVEVETERLGSGQRTPALTAQFVMVAVDKEGKPARVPQLIVSTEDEVRLYTEAQKRYANKKKAAGLPPP